AAGALAAAAEGIGHTRLPGEAEDAVLVVGRIALRGDAELLQIGLADRQACRLASLAEGGEQNADEQRDDGNDHQQLDERESGPECLRAVHPIIPYALRTSSVPPAA